nr:uncharacterized protein LOC123762955 [Procambarus clarkii]
MSLYRVYFSKKVPQSQPWRPQEGVTLHHRLCSYRDEKNDLYISLGNVYAYLSESLWWRRTGSRTSLWVWTALLTVAHVYLWRQELGHLYQQPLQKNSASIQVLERYRRCVKKACWRLNLRYPILRATDGRLVHHLRRLIDSPPGASQGLLDRGTPPPRTFQGRLNPRNPLQEVFQGHLDPHHPPWHNVTSYSVTEKVIRDVFGTAEGGVFVEVGAQDGLWLSNSWWLEAARGWRGLLVEADPHNYLHLRTSPRTSRTLPVCVTTGLRVKQESLVRREPEVGNTILGMHQRGMTMLTRFATPRDHYLGKTWDATCFPLLSVLAAAGYRQINLLIFDVTGGGFELMQDFFETNSDLGHPFRAQAVLYQDTSLVNNTEMAEEARALGYTHLAISSSHFLLLHRSLGVALA